MWFLKGGGISFGLTVLLSLQLNMSFNLFELDEGGESLALIKPKQEHKLTGACCQHKTSSAKTEELTIRDNAVPGTGSSDMTVPKLVGVDCDDAFSSLDDILCMKDFSRDFKELEVEPGTLGCEMWEETFTEVLFPSLLAV